MNPHIGKLDRVKIEDSVLCQSLRVKSLTVDTPLKTNGLDLNGLILTGSNDANYTLTLPATPGTAGQYLTTDGFGTLNWTTFGGTNNVNAENVENTPSRAWLSTGNQTFSAMYTFTDVLNLNGATLNGPVSSQNPLRMDNFLRSGGNATTFVNYEGRNITLDTISNTSHNINFKVSSTSPNYDVQWNFSGGTNSNGTAPCLVRARSLHFKTPSGLGVGWSLRTVPVTASATKLSYLDVNAPNNLQSATQPQTVVTDSNLDVGTFNLLSCSVLKYKNVFQTGITTWSSGSVSTLENKSIFIANTSGSHCTLVLTTPVQGRQIHVLRADSGSTNALIVDAATNYVRLQNVLPGYIVTRTPYQALTLIGTWNGWVIAPTLPSVTNYVNFTKYLWTIPYAVGQFRVATLDVTYRAVSLTASSIVTFTGLTSFSSPIIPVQSQNLFTNELGVTLPFVQTNRTWFVCNESFNGETAVMVLGAKYSSNYSNNVHYVDVVGWGYVRVGGLEYTHNDTTPNNGTGRYWSMATTIPLTLQGGEDYTLPTISQDENDLTITPLNLNVQKYNA